MQRPFYRGILATVLLFVVALTVSCIPQDPVVGDLYLQNIYPSQTNTFDLGSPAYQWQDLWVTNINGAAYPPGIAPAHTILSASHTDSTVAAVVRGDIITGQGVAPTWTRLGLGGIGSFLASDGTDAGWRTLLAADIPDVSGTYIPYIGASANVDLGIRTLTTTGAVGIGTPSTATELLTVYYNVGGAGSMTALDVSENSGSVGAKGVYVHVLGAKTGASYGVDISNAATSGTNGIDKFALRLSSTSVWNGVGANNYALYISNPTGGTTNYSIYSAGGQNYLAGNTGIGVAQSAVLTLAGGTMAAGTASLKLTSGALLTAPEAGAIEFVNDTYYGTITTGPTRKQFAFTDSTVTTATNAVNVGITNDDATNAVMYPLWVTANTGNLPVKVSSGTLTWNPFTDALSATTFVGALQGNADTATSATTAGTATNAVNSGITNDDATAATMYPVWVTANAGNLPLKVSSTKLSFKPSTGALSVSDRVGIGIAAPNYALDVEDAGTVYTYVKSTAAGTTGLALDRFANDVANTAQIWLGTSGAVDWSFGTNQGAAATDAFSIYSYGGSANTLTILKTSGRVGVGEVAPTAALHLKAGTIAASTAPLKFTSGPLLTNPEAGAVEFLTDAYYGTITTGAARKQFAFTDGTVTNATNAVNIGITNDDATNAVMYPLWVTANAGNLPAKVSSGTLTWNPSTDTLSATTFSGALSGNASTASSAAKWTTARNLAGNSVDGSANVAFSNAFIVQGTVDAGLSGAQFMGALGTGIVKNTTVTGVLSIAVAGDFPTLNQSTTGSANSLKSPTTSGLITVTGMGAGTTRVKTVRDADDTILELGGSYTPTAVWDWTTAAVTWPTFNQNTSGTAAGLSAVLVASKGGTGIANNNLSTLTISGNFATTLTVAGIASITVPHVANQLLYSSAADTVGGLATAASSILVTDGAGVPSLSTTTPAHTWGGAITANGQTLGNLSTTTLSNNVNLRWLDSVAAAQNIMVYNGSNQLWLHSPGGLMILQGTAAQDIYVFTSTNGTGRALSLQGTAATVGSTVKNSPSLQLVSRYWSGVSTSIYNSIAVLQDSTAPNQHMQFAVGVTNPVVLNLYNNNGTRIIAPQGDIQLLASTKAVAASGVVGFSTVSTALTLGTGGAMIAPYGNMSGAANDAARDAIAGNLNGALAVDSGDPGRMYWRANGVWYYYDATP